jgi:hypothetical protein
MAAAVRYHINPDNQVKRCSAASEDSCPFGAEAHFTGTKDQAEFMQETLNAAPRSSGMVKSDYIQMRFRDDDLRATKEADGKYTIKLADGTVLDEHVDLVGGGDAAGLKRWAVKDSPYQANHIELADHIDPKVTELRAVFHKNEAGALEHTGFIYKHTDQDGWNAAESLNDLRGDVHPYGRGYLGAISQAHALTKVRHEEAQRQLRESSMIAVYEYSKGLQIDSDEANRVLHRNLNWEDRVYKLDPDLVAQAREKFRATTEERIAGHGSNAGQMPDDEDEVYIHEVRDSRNDARIDSIKVIWGARSWSTRAQNFFSGEGVSAQTGFINWLHSSAA